MDIEITKRQQQIQQYKQKLLVALEKTLGVVSEACRIVKLDRTTFYRYVKEDLDFAAAVQEIDNVALDFVEGALYEQIKAGIPSSTIFYLKTKGRNRGYIERHEIVPAFDIQAEIAKYFEKTSSPEITQYLLENELPIQVLPGKQ